LLITSLGAASYKLQATRRWLRTACSLLLAACSLFLSLALLKAGILFVDDVQFALPAHNLAINTALFNGCSYFHIRFI